MRDPLWLAWRVVHLAHGLTGPCTHYDDLCVYRGTTSVRDALFDIDVRTADFHGVLVHRGVLAMYRAATEGIGDAATPRVLGGYSCGGAIAMLHAVDAVVRGDPVDAVVSVAAPHFVHPQSVARLEHLLADVDVVARVVNPHDPIPRAPPHLVSVGDVHVLEVDGGDGWMAQHSSVTYAIALEEALLGVTPRTTGAPGRPAHSPTRRAAPGRRPGRATRAARSTRPRRQRGAGGGGGG